MAKYLACGNIMSDGVIRADGTEGELHIGGPAMFALSGIRLFTDSCKLVSGAGADFEETYGKWMSDNGLSCENIRVVCEHCTQHVITHMPDNSYRSESRFGQEAMGFMKTHPEHIEAAIDEDTKAFYLAQNDDYVFWKNLAKVKEKKDVHMMWEMEPKLSDLKKIKDVISIPEMFSLNFIEASRLFNIPRDNDEDIINELMKLPVDFTLYRVGPRGAYAVTPSTAVFCGSIDPYGKGIDPTGCGNTSTGASMVAFEEGYDPTMIVAMSNVASGFNAAQYGPTPVITNEIESLAIKLSSELAASVRK